MVLLNCTTLACRVVAAQLSTLKQDLLTNGYQEAEEQIRLFNDDRMPLKPGCDPIQVRTKPSSSDLLVVFFRLAFALVFLPDRVFVQRGQGVVPR